VSQTPTEIVLPFDSLICNQGISTSAGAQHVATTAGNAHDKGSVTHALRGEGCADCVLHVLLKGPHDIAVNNA
jgi:hypothetical protein